MNHRKSFQTAVSLLIFSISACLGAPKQSLSALWKNYEAARQADLPEDQMNILDKIISASASPRSPWDFYRAWNCKVEVGSSIDWKQYESMRQARKEAFAAFDEPVINFLVSDEAFNFEKLKAQQKTLAAKTNRGFYGKNESFLSNDWQYLLWCHLGGNKEVTEALREEFGPVMDLYSEQDTFRKRLDELNGKKSTQEQYIQLRSDITAFEKRRLALSGREGALAATFTAAQATAQAMDRAQCDVSCDEKNINIVFTNLSSATVTLSRQGESKALFHSVVTNKASSYYVPDSVSIDFPKVDDGEYELTLQAKGVESRNLHVVRHSISAALVRDKDGVKVFAARYDSGKPLDCFDVTLLDGKNRTIASAKAVKRTAIWAKLPETIVRAMENGGQSYPQQRIVCSFTDNEGLHRTSEPIFLRSPQSYTTSEGARQSAVILKDCGAFHRGDCVHFKTIVYSGSYFDDLATAAAGTAVDAEFLDTEGKTIDKLKLRTDQWGAADGKFTIPDNIRGGMMRIRISGTGLTLAESYLRVDDFVLPDFDCTFEKIDEFYFPGDTVTVKGCVKAYSGHNISADGAYYTVSGTDEKKPMRMERDGSFAIKVPTTNKRWWNSSVTVVVTSSTGQTLEWTKVIPLSQSVNLRAELIGGLDASIESDTESEVVEGDVAVFCLNVLNPEGVKQSLTVNYTVSKGGVQLYAGAVRTPDELALPLSQGCGEYNIVFTVADHKFKRNIIRVSGESDSIDADIENIFVPLQSPDGIAFAIGATRGNVWAVASVYAGEGRLLWTELLHLEGRRASEGSLMTVHLSRKVIGNEACKAVVFYFRNGEYHSWSHEFDGVQADDNMHFSWSRLTGSAKPGSTVNLSFSTNYPAQTTLAVFDKSTETVQDNLWREVMRRTRSVTAPSIAWECGAMSGEIPLRFKMTRTMMATADVALMAYNRAESNVEEADGVEADTESPSPRRDFASVICWEPSIHTDGKNPATISFTASDKAGTFIVSAFSFDKRMHNTLTRCEMLVTLPVIVTLAPADILSQGDRIVLKATVSSMIDKDICGELVFSVPGSDVFKKNVRVAAGGVCAEEFETTVPEGITSLPVKVGFRCDEMEYSDAVEMNVPVRSKTQKITEAHSAVCLDGNDADAIVQSLQSRFTGTTAFGAHRDERNIVQMLRSAISPRTDIESDKFCTSLDVTSDICVNLLYDRMNGTSTPSEALFEKLRRFESEDGGWSWIEGMAASPWITAAILHRNASTGGFLPKESVEKAVKYLDRSISSFNLEHFVFIRSFYPEVAFAATDKLAGTDGKKMLKALKDYLIPSSSRGFNANVWAKTVRAATLQNLIDAGENAAALLKTFKLGGKTSAMRRSLNSDIKSLSQYAVKHHSGGMYFPNLVMPFRGLLSSEAWYHSIMCGVMDRHRADIADGVRLWLMIQKETQHWDSNFEFATTVATVLDGTKQLLDTKVITLTKSYEKPFSEIVAAGNGFTVSRSFELTSASGAKSILHAGDSLRVGDKVTAIYSIFSDENRSFVRLSVPRHGCLHPVNQNSGFHRSGYREVRNGCSTYYFESYPEQKTQVREEFFVNQSGSFSAPVPEIESLYAPHYRANGSFEGIIISK